jgi:ribosomal protein L11 methyltransferase
LITKGGNKAMDGNWIEIKVVTSSSAVEPVSGIFYGMDVKGVAIEDPNDIYTRKQGALTWDFADINIFEYGGDAAVVKGYFSNEDDEEHIKAYIEEKLAEIKDMGIDIGKGEIKISHVKEEDWSTAWKKYYKTTRLGKTIIIKPTWEEYTPVQGDNIIELDPGMAFGTGTHETTVMCAELLEKYVRDSNTVFDIGTGSGILAITAAKLGAKEVKGVDLDEVAVDAARENVEHNNLNNVEILHGDLVNVLEGKADIVVANIIADVIIYLTDIIPPFIKENGLFITSGIIHERKQDVVDALKAKGFDIAEVREMGEWVAIAARI